MAILFDWYEDPKPSNKQQGENGNTLHPRIKYNGSTGTDVLRRRIQERCSLTETDVTAVLDALSHIMGQELAEGRQVHLDGIGYFPDAPTERGVKHLHELAQAQQAGYRCAVAFVIQMEGITEVRPNVSTQPEFGTALAEAKAAGVRVLFLLCRVGRDSLEIVEQREG